ncbi:G-protein coupled receptor 83-like [Oppia nitens]|uniref:G-protein coupled receptor 83-like n=1 Tax=Oppia nitens TaxID=1686743 RepID=UPI0023DA88F0|nr:G-protein coupled receptor 83-like [Oppia nitens]
MRTTTNMLIATLAISDLVTTVFNIPFNVARLLLLNWPFGSILCFLLPLIQCACVYVSTFTMAVIAVHRWHTVRKAHRPLATPQRRFSCLRLSAVVAVIGLLALGLSLPNAIFNETKQAVIYGTVVVRCRVTYPPDIGFNIRRFLTVEVFITQYLTPLFVTLVVYIEIGIFVWRQGRVLAISNDDRRRQQSEAKRRRILMLALVVIVFAVCWLPINVYHLLVDFKLIKHNFTVFLVVHWFAMSSVCYNPFIYCWLNESFRKGSKKFLKSLVRCRTQAPGGKPYITTTTTTIMTTKANAIANNINNTNARALVGLPTSAGAATAADSLLVSNCLGGAAAAAATLDDIGGNDGQQHRRNRQHIDTTTTTTTTTATITTTLGSPTTHCTISSV